MLWTDILAMLRTAEISLYDARGAVKRGFHITHGAWVDAWSVDVLTWRVVLLTLSLGRRLGHAIPRLVEDFRIEPSQVCTRS